MSLTVKIQTGKDLLERIVYLEDCCRKCAVSGSHECRRKCDFFTDPLFGGGPYAYRLIQYATLENDEDLTKAAREAICELTNKANWIKGLNYLQIEQAIKAMVIRKLGSVLDG